MTNQKNSKTGEFLRYVKQHYMLYVFILPSFAYLFIFHYIPFYGIQIAFKNFRPIDGIWGSRWIGFDNFIRFFESYHFWTLIENTLAISLYSLLAGFPIPIILALMFNYCKFPRLKKITQSITYAPHFISTVVMVGRIILFLSPRAGFVNIILEMLGFEKIQFMSQASLFRHIYVWSGVWQSMGFASVIYIAALSSVDLEKHEAAIVDGANKIKRIWYIDIPTILPTMIILLILSTGSLLSVGFEKVFLMQNSLNLRVSEIISTYVYKVGLIGAQYSFATSIGLFNNIINVTILLLVNKLAKSTSDISLW